MNSVLDLDNLQYGVMSGYIQYGLNSRQTNYLIDL